MKVELLSPAGNYESFLGAVNAGADAVYLGGEKFGARAYASNFSEEELCRALRYAHLGNRKIYLTLNTLVKESEFSELYHYLHPFYEEGLDGIIVQDLGVFSYLKETFPGLPLHVSTQATVTGVSGASFLHDLGAQRIVPARELSLEEIITIKKQVPIELETFIHGAMCYCYSGQCLFSSIAGGRSGNRGRCAQPCRLPYQVNQSKEEAYYLSLKDMCTIQHLPQLMEAGIDSFKIEGRMKKPEYTAGVTSLYRKYIDAYCEAPKKEYKVHNKDLEKLSSLYIRSEVQNGYYFKQNGEDMITLTSPAYSGNNVELLAQIKEKYLIGEQKKKIDISLFCHKGKPLTLTLTLEDRTVTVEGDLVQEAMNQPATHDSLYEKISRFGDSFFQVNECQIYMDEHIFVPVKALNELRRYGIKALEDAILKPSHDTLTSSIVTTGAFSDKNSRTAQVKKGITILISTKEQLTCVLPFSNKLQRIYIESYLLFQDDIQAILKKHFANKGSDAETQLFIALPFIMRQNKIKFLNKLEIFLENNNNINGCLVRNIDELGFLVKKPYGGMIALDPSLHVLNRRACSFFSQFADSICFSYEMNKGERRTLLKDQTKIFEQVIYGKIPMMVTANCLAKTTSGCKKTSYPNDNGKLTLTDRYKNQFPVWTNCDQCYNIIWNHLPLSLHQKAEEFKKENLLLRLQFTTESTDEMLAILNFYLDNTTTFAFPLSNYTTGHEKRGIE